MNWKSIKARMTRNQMKNKNKIMIAFCLITSTLNNPIQVCLFKYGSVFVMLVKNNLLTVNERIYFPFFQSKAI